MGNHYDNYYERNPFAVEFDQHRANLRTGAMLQKQLESRMKELDAMLQKQLESRMKELDAMAESTKAESRKRSKKVLLCL